jgi:hypothetical protein
MLGVARSEESEVFGKSLRRRAAGLMKRRREFSERRCEIEIDEVDFGLY